MFNPFFSLQMPCRNRGTGNFGKSSTPSCTQKNTKQCRQGGMKKNCDEEEIYNQFIYKNSEFGGTLIPHNTEKGTIYKIASINVDTSYFGDFIVKLNFSCNLSLEKAGIHIKFQIFKQVLNQLESVPISSEFYFQKKKESNDRTMFSFFSCDGEHIRSKCCNYSVHVQVINASTKGTVIIENSTLLAAILESI